MHLIIANQLKILLTVSFVQIGIENRNVDNVYRDQKFNFIAILFGINVDETKLEISYAQVRETWNMKIGTFFNKKKKIKKMFLYSWHIFLLVVNTFNINVSSAFIYITQMLLKFMVNYSLEHC